MGSCISHQRKNSSKTSKTPIIKRFPWQNFPSVTQNFDFPDSIIYYMIKNPPTPKIYLKLSKLCKYFFEKNRVIVAARIHDNGKKVCSRNEEECAKKNQKCCVNLDSARLSSKIWLTNKLDISSFDIPTFTPLFVSKLYRCEDAHLHIISKIITLNDFRLYASKFVKFYLDCVIVVNSDGRTVMLEEILGSIKNIRVFYYYFGDVIPSATASTLKNMTILKNLDNLLKIVLYNLPEVIDIHDLEEFIMNHNNIKIWLQFNLNISEEYKNKIDHLIDTVIDSGVPNHFINYRGQNEGKLNIMQSRYIF